MKFKSGSSSGSRLRKKHKRLDAICERVYNQNHSESVADMEPRRSSRVRRPPVILDASPPPPKKRKKTYLAHATSSLKSVKEEEEEEDKVEVEDEDESESVGDFDSLGSWRLRLRSRGVQQKGGQASPRRKLFHQVGNGESELGPEKLTGVRSKKPGKVKAVNGFLIVEKKAGTQLAEDVSKKDVGEVCIWKDESLEHELDTPTKEGEEGSIEVLEEGIGGRNQGEEVDSVAVKLALDETEGKERLDGMELGERPDGNRHVDEMELGKRLDGTGDEDTVELEERLDGNGHVDGVELGEGLDGNGHADRMEWRERLDANGHVENIEIRGNKNMEELESGLDGKNEADIVKVDELLMNGVEDGGRCHEGESGVVEVDEMTLGDVKDAKVQNFKHGSVKVPGRSEFKQGRRCGLCGCGNDGRPPKRLLQDAGDSENEAYCGSSASEEANYDMWDGFGDEPGWLGRLLGPINDRYGIAGIWVHQHCAVWSPEVYFAGLGCLKNMRAALCRGRALKCSRCGRPGATIGCRVDRCPKTYHLPCARASSCIFDHRKFLIACTYHRHLFQPHGNRYALRVKKLKAKKMKLEMRKLSNDAWRKDVEAEEKWLENCGEDDEFLKREGKRLHRDLLRIAPVYIGGSESGSGKPFEGWESVAGLQDVIRCMKEVVILPLLYPEFFSNLGITPPRGVLLHGYPGTGKTLVVRALVGSCARGDKRIAYFARKGADCLGKYVGDAERQLRLLFQVAERCQPSIIFFDEIDGLAPCRTRQQDQTHSSVVSTLLALMDGLKSRGSVVVIGATNRPEAVDPALRRPGRFDREIYFPLPSVEDRAAILSLHTQSWPKPVTGSLLKWIATKTVGFAGADLQALCTQAAIIALRRNFPLQEVLSVAGDRAPTSKRIPLPAFAVEERDWLEALSCAPPPCSRREAGIAASDFVSSPLPTHLTPCLMQPLSTFLVSLYLNEHLWLPPSLLEAGASIKNAIVYSLEKRNLPCDNWWFHVNTFLKEPEVEKEVLGRLSCLGMLIGESRCADTDASVGHEGLHSNFSRSISFQPRTKSGFRVLIAGNSRSGQRHLASCILHCFVGNVEVQKVDLATISQEGHGDLVQGMTQILMRCSGFKSCMIFMPRIDLWAMDSCHSTSQETSTADEKESCSPQSQFTETENDSSAYNLEVAEISALQLSTKSASLAWSTFIAQVESICVSTSLMILATSELPYQELPPRVRQFFKDDFANSSPSTLLEHTVPRFSVHVDGNFNRDAVIRLSAEALLRDMIQSFIQFIHYRNHVHTSSAKDHIECDPVQGCFDAEYPIKYHSPKVPSMPCNRFKGKSSLLFAISTFGYQILRYPHFAELCWVTSKLKEGPCADVSGPWKGWPFNSCIIRPGNPLDKVAVGCSSGNSKSKERSGLVRGLMAVGLLAYRGMYKSVKEVSFEVRKVLELLVRQVNEKIEAGKDRYQYVRLLSQVAYLEDMVNNWAYALQSIEPDVHMKVSNTTVTTAEIPNIDTLVENSIQFQCKGNTSSGSPHESVLLGGSPHQLSNVVLEGSDKGEKGFSYPDSEGTAAMLEAESAQKCSLGDHMTHNNPDKQCQNSTPAQFVGNVANDQNGRAPRQCVLNAETPVVTDERSDSLRHANGFTSLDDGMSSENGFHNSLDSSAFDIVGSGKSCNRSDIAMEDRIDNKKLNCTVDAGDTHLAPRKTLSVSDDSSVVCSYRCCEGCLNSLHSIIQKVLIHELGLNKTHLTAEDIHDIVASLSSSLLSAVRKVDLAGKASKVSDGNLKCVNAEKFSDCLELNGCHCGSSGEGILMPMECSCHPVIGWVTGKEKLSSISQCGLNPNFVFRDGILVPVDSKTHVSLHCKYETLCLCSLIQTVVMMKQPFD